MLGIHAVHTLLLSVLFGPEDKLIKSLQSMAIFRIIDQLIASQNVGLTEPLRKLRILHSSPLHRHLQLILAAVNEETDEIKNGEVEQNEQKDKSGLTQNDDVVKDSV